MEKKTITVNRNHKDTMFRKLFSDKKELLSLYNALYDTAYEDPNELEIVTLENAIYMKHKNDLSCILSFRLSMIEHMSSINPNLPLRFLKYVVEVIDSITINQDIYSRKYILLPNPSFFVLYNGAEKQPERRIMRLSDSYMDDTNDEPDLELIVTQLNLNDGFNESLKKKCPTLMGYCRLVSIIRANMKKYHNIEKSTDEAVDTCIREGTLVEFLNKNRKEVSEMSLFEFNEELHNRTLREEGREEGRNEVLNELLSKGMLTPEQVKEVQKETTPLTPV